MRRFSLYVHCWKLCRVSHDQPVGHGLGARTLHKNGRVFLVEAFHGNAELADSVNHLLVVGFYLVNLGYVALALRTGAALLTPREAIELESQKIGWVLLILGAMHFFNIFVFHRMRQRSQAPRIARATELI